MNLVWLETIGNGSEIIQNFALICSVNLTNFVE